MTVVVVGSRALNRRITNFRPARDLDLIGPYDEIVEIIKTFGKMKVVYPASKGKKLIAKAVSGEIIECEIAWDGSTAEKFVDLVEKDPFTLNGFPHNWLVPDIDALYAMKMSHRYLRNSPHFMKTREDIFRMRDIRETAEIPKYYQEWYEERMKETYSYDHPNLDVTKSAFFAGDGVEYMYDHDSIHQSVKFGFDPAYKSYQEPGSEVMCSKALWDKCDDRVKLWGVVEEAMVLAIERSLVPFPGALTPEQAFEVALKKVCTSITSGWFREYAWENYTAIRNSCPTNYWANFQTDVKYGRVKEHETA